jgi:hypothetical protein
MKLTKLLPHVPDQALTDELPIDKLGQALTNEH